MVQSLTQLMNKCWEEEQIPDEWRKGIIVKLPKKGNITYCSNWRGITLLSVPGKAFCTVLLVRLRDAVDVYCEKSKQDSGMAGPAQSKSSPCITSWNSVLNFNILSWSISLTLRKHSRVFTVIHSGKSV